MSSAQQRAHDEVMRIQQLLLAAGVDTCPPATPEPISADDERLLQSIVKPAVLSRVPRAEARRGTVRRVQFAVAACAAVAVAAAASLLWAPSDAAQASTPAVLQFEGATVAEVLTGQIASPTSALRAVARAASAAPSNAGSGAQRVQSYGWYLNIAADQSGDTTTQIAPTFQTTTLGADGSFTNEERRAPALSIKGTVIDPDDYPVGGATSTDNLPAGTLDAWLTSALPTDPPLLRAALLEQQAGSGCGESQAATLSCLFHAITELYSKRVVSRDLSASIWNMLAAEPSLAWLGDTTDRLGRSGLAVAFPPVPGRTSELLVLIINPANGDLLEWDEIAAGIPELDVRDPAVIAFQAIADARWID